MDQLFADVFPDGIPNNSYIDKSRTSLGLTHSEFYADRSSIIVVPTITIIEDKARSYKNKKPFKLHNDSDDDELKAYLKSTKPEHKKIIVTPDSFGRLINAAEEIGLLDEVLNNYFCLLDEVHCYATERFRALILTPFKFFWKFKFKAVGTATPYHFSDPEFHKLDYFKLVYDEKFGTVVLMEHEDIIEALAFLLSDLSKFPGNIHIFLNSVKLINRVISKARLKDAAVFCADEERNSDTLGDNSIYFRPAPVTGEYAKVNFYSAKYNEGWDLVDDENCTFVLATDMRFEHSISTIHFKGFQAIGRLRSSQKINGRPVHIKPLTIYHITNTIPITKQKQFSDFDTVRETWFFEAKEHVSYYNSFMKKCREQGRLDKGIVKTLIKPFADISYGEAVLVPNKVDQNIYEEYYKQFYYSIELVKVAWEDMNYDVQIKRFPDQIEVYGESGKSINKRIIEALEKTRLNPEHYDERTTDAYFRKIKGSHKELFLSYNALGGERMRELDYDNKAMLRERIKVSNNKLFKLIASELQSELEVNRKYARQEIKAILQAKYNKHSVYCNRKKIKKANLNDLKEFMGLHFVDKGKCVYKEKLCPSIIFPPIAKELDDDC